MSMSKEPSGLYEPDKGTLTYAIGHIVYRYSRNYTKLLKGKLLTQIDATFQDQQQRKAQKDLVSQLCDDLLFEEFNNLVTTLTQQVGEIFGEKPYWGEQACFLNGELVLRTEDLQYSYSRMEKQK